MEDRAKDNLSVVQMIRMNTDIKSFPVAPAKTFLYLFYVKLQVHNSIDVLFQIFHKLDYRLASFLSALLAHAKQTGCI